MPIISKETWDNLVPKDEKEKIYNRYLHALRMDDTGTVLEFEYLFGKEQLQPQPQPLTYEDVARELFKDKEFFIYDSENDVIVPELRPLNKPINCTSRKQAEKLLAINKLLNVAKFLNKDWKPDWKRPEQDKWYIYINEKNEISVNVVSSWCSGDVYFRTEEIARQAIQILGEDTVRLALGNF